MIDVFHSACGDMGLVAAAAEAEPKEIAERVFLGLIENDYGQYDDLIEVLSPTLGSQGLEHLKQLFLAQSNEPLPTPGETDQQVFGLGSYGPSYRNDYAARHREITTRLALEQIADAQGDVDAFIAQQSDKAKGAPRVAAQIAQRLLNAGRREDAWEAINAINEDRPGWIPFEWEQARLDVLEALDRRGEAQSFRWSCFQRSLNATHLRAYLKYLPDPPIDRRGMS